MTTQIDYIIKARDSETYVAPFGDAVSNPAFAASYDKHEHALAASRGQYRNVVAYPVIIKRTITLEPA